MWPSRSERVSGSSPRARGTVPQWRRFRAAHRFIPASAGNRPHPRGGTKSHTVHPRERGEQEVGTHAHDAAAGSSPRARGTAVALSPGRLLPRFIPASAGNSEPVLIKGYHKTVHPRERGEQGQSDYLGVRVGGSSPRARGTVGRKARVFLPHRFIPASAGNRARWWCGRSGSPVHPRERGEQIRATSFSKRDNGSSPRARGTGVHGRGARRVLRFIPASAGNRLALDRRRARTTVHPRERGEQLRGLGGGFAHHGSSPRARGTVLPGPSFPGEPRFIPASAGNRSRCISSRPLKPVHPRERGEQEVGVVFDANLFGSSPRARGTDVSGQLCLTLRRFIPASAGNRASGRPAADLCAVHPRERGEQMGGVYVLTDFSGSSPRARGTVGGLADEVGHFRFIPASAGNSCVAPSRTGGQPVHPRERGEQGLDPGDCCLGLGSSPRARGTGPVPGAPGVSQRFIPASAGNRPGPNLSADPDAVHPRERGEQQPPRRSIAA